MIKFDFRFSLPDWLSDYADEYRTTTSTQEQMAFVIGASRRNIEEATGGPFAAAIFNAETGGLVSVGVNLVTHVGSSVMHAEMVAIMLAQRALGGYDLGAGDLPDHALFASTEPCAMCFGAIPWSGIRRVVTAASDADAREIGFDEGPKTNDWVKSLAERGIDVAHGVLREEAKNVLLQYKANGGHIYNSREA